MGLFDKGKKATIGSRRYEEKLYEIALQEVEDGEARKGLYAIALSKAGGDKEKANGFYLKLRVQSIRDDIESEQIERRRIEKTYKEYQQEFSIEVETPPSEIECKELLGNKGYELHRSTSGEYQVGAKDNPVFSTKDLSSLKEWASKAERA